MAMFYLLKIKTSIDIFKNEKCKVTFGLEYTMTLNHNFSFLPIHQVNCLSFYYVSMMMMMMMM